MYSIGLVRFMEAKKLKSKEAIDAFLESEGITEFTSKNHHRVNAYIQKNWTKFASFIDRSLKEGKIKGKPVKLNHYYDEQAERRREIAEQIKMVTPEEKALYNLIKQYDCVVQMGRTQNFFNKRGYKLPGNNKEEEGKPLARMIKVLPKLQFILGHDLYNEYIEFLTSSVNQPVNESK